MLEFGLPIPTRLVSRPCAATSRWLETGRSVLASHFRDSKDIKGPLLEAPLTGQATFASVWRRRSLSLVGTPLHGAALREGILGLYHLAWVSWPVGAEVCSLPMRGKIV